MGRDHLLGSESECAAQRGREARPFRYLVTGEVHAYIVEHDLYANDSGDDMVGKRMDMETTS